MTESLPSHVSTKCDIRSNSWENQARVLRCLVRGWVYSTHVPLWLGAKEDVVSDIVQEAICRTLERLRKAERQEAAPVNYPDCLSRTIAYHLFIDFMRKDTRLIPLSQLTRSSDDEVYEFELADSSEEMSERVFQESLFNELATEIVNFPNKQKFALLVDLANHTNFASNEAMLRKAFLKVGIRLEDYLGLQPENGIERSRFASLLSISYKRVIQLNCIEPYTK